MGIHSLSGSILEGDSVSRSEGRRWFVANAFTGREKEAESHLRNQGFETFNPVETRTVRHARRLVTKEKAFFPGYIFVKFDVELDRWRCINSTRGIKTLIMQREQPVACPRRLVEELIGSADENGVIDTSSRLQPGQKIRVRSGPFAEFVGTLERLDNAGRAKVLLEMMAGERAVRMGTQDIESL